MAGNDSIKLLRKNGAPTDAELTDLLDGQPLYDKENNKLYIGNKLKGKGQLINADSGGGGGGTGANAATPIKLGTVYGATTGEGAPGVAGYYTSLGYNARATSNQSVAIGYNAKAYSSPSAVAIGVNSNARANYAIAIGINSNAGSNDAIALGRDVMSNGLGSIAIGNGSKSGAQAGTHDIAIGVNANAAGSRSMAIGAGSTSSDESTTVGANSRASTNSSALGAYAKADKHGVALGYNSSASGNSVSIGRDTISINGSVVIGSQININQYQSNHVIAIGSAVNSLSEQSIAIGHLSNASNDWGIALGSYTQASGLEAVAIGSTTVAKGDYSMALGYNATANNANEIVLGNYNISSLKCAVTTITSLSDERTKEDITAANTARCLEIVNEIPLKRYKFKKYARPNVLDNHKLGFIAQDVEKVFPNNVETYDEDFPMLDTNGNPIIENEVDGNGNYVYSIVGDDEDGQPIYASEPNKVQKKFTLKNVKHLGFEQAIPSLWGAVQYLSQQVKDLQIELEAIKNK